jgi:hypothetical protein
MNDTTTREQAPELQVEPAPKLPAVQGATAGAGRYLNEVAPRSYPSAIAKAMIAISRDIGEIAKDGFNQFQKYKYQDWQDIVREVRKAMIAHGIMVTQSEVNRTIEDRLVAITYQFTIVHEGGDVWPERPVWTGMARLTDQKGVMDDKAINKAATQAHKYWLIHQFNISTPDAEDSDGEATVKPAPRRAAEQIATDAEKKLEPHGIVAKGPGMWTDAYCKAIRAARSVEEVDAWYLANKHNLVTLSKTSQTDYRTCELALRRRREELKAEIRPLPPRVDQVDAETGEITEGLDGDQWLKDLEGALVGTEDLGELAKIKTDVLLAARDQVGEDYYKLGSALYMARLKNVMGAPD